MRRALVIAAVMSLLTVMSEPNTSAAQSRISITVVNFSGFDKTFDLRDENCGTQWSVSLKEWEKRPISLCTSSAGYGRLLYKKQGDSGWTQSSLLSNGETVNM